MTTLRSHRARLSPFWGMIFDGLHSRPSADTQIKRDTAELRRLKRRSGELDLLAIYSDGPCTLLNREMTGVRRKLTALHLTYSVSANGALEPHYGKAVS